MLYGATFLLVANREESLFFSRKTRKSKKTTKKRRKKQQKTEARRSKEKIRNLRLTKQLSNRLAPLLHPSYKR